MITTQWLGSTAVRRTLVIVDNWYFKKDNSCWKLLKHYVGCCNKVNNLREVFIRDKLAYGHVVTNCQYSIAQIKSVLWEVFIRDELAYVQVVTNYQYSAAQMCTWEEYSPAI